MAWTTDINTEWPHRQHPRPIQILTKTLVAWTTDTNTDFQHWESWTTDENTNYLHWQHSRLIQNWRQPTLVAWTAPTTDTNTDYQHWWTTDTYTDYSHWQHPRLIQILTGDDWYNYCLPTLLVTRTTDTNNDFQLWLANNWWKLISNFVCMNDWYKRRSSTLKARTANRTMIFTTGVTNSWYKARMTTLAG